MFKQLFFLFHDDQKEQVEQVELLRSTKVAKSNLVASWQHLLERIGCNH